MHVHDAAGRPLNATFSAEPEGNWVALIMESRSGRAAGRPGRNADYNPALTLLLERLARLDATLVAALVDSRKTQALGIPEMKRRLITEPVKLALVPDMEAFRAQMGTAQAKIAQEPDATKGVTRRSGSGYGSTFPDTGRTRLSGSRASFLSLDPPTGMLCRSYWRFVFLV
jgi:hypothetical protein